VLLQAFFAEFVGVRGVVSASISSVSAGLGSAVRTHRHPSVLGA
jgi:hypothetical protein